MSTDSKEWYSAKELAGLPGMPATEQSVKRKAKISKWQFRDVPGKGGPGGTRREYAFSSLPPETRAALLTIASEAAAASSSADLAAFLASRRISLSPAQLADPAWQRRIACYRAFHTCPAYSGRSALISSLAASHHVSPATIRRWVEAVETLSLRRAPRVVITGEPIEIPRSHSFAPEAAAYGLSYYAQNLPAGIKEAYRRMRRAASENGWRCSDDYTAFWRMVRRLPPAVFARIRRGPLGAELSLIPKIIREWTAVPVQSVLCGDQKIFDYYVIECETGDIIVPEGYFFMDCSSRMINGVAVELGHYNSFTVGAALRESLSYGLGDSIFTDWGKPEGSKHVAHILKGLSGVSETGDFAAMAEKYADVESEQVESEKFDHLRPPPCEPWKKPIENIMNIVEIGLRDQGLPGYRKRARDAWENKEVQAKVRREAASGALLSVQDFMAVLLKVVDEHNRKEKRLREGGSLVPLDFFSAGLAAAPRPVLPDHTLDYICLPYFERVPMQGGVDLKIRGRQRRYVSPVLSQYCAAKKRTKVGVSVDPYDYNEPAVICDLEGNFLGLAEPWGVQNPYDAEGIARKTEYQASLKKWFTAQARTLKSGFGVLPEGVSIGKITPQSYTARRAEKARQIRDRNQENARLVAASQRADADIARDELVAKFAAAERQMGEGRPLASLAGEMGDWRLEMGEKAAAPLSPLPSPVSGAPGAAPDNVASFRPFHVPPEGRDRFVFYLELNERVVLAPQGLAEALTEQERTWFEHYPTTPDYKACDRLWKEYGSTYLQL